ncbi:MAG: type II secretion system protein N [Sphingomonadaceae bacterium]
MTSAPAWRHPASLALLALLVVLVAWLASRALAAVMAPIQLPSLAGAESPPDLAILARFDPFFRRQPQASSDSLPVTSLPLALKGVRLDPVSGRGAAIIAGADGVQDIYAPGETVTDGVVLEALAADHVVLVNAGTRESLWLEEAGGPPVTMPALAAAPPGALARGGDAAAGMRPDPAEQAEPETPAFLPEDEETQ